MSENIEDFISFHNANIMNPELSASVETLSLFAAAKNIPLEDVSIEKHRMPFINWRTSLGSSQT
ncbi:MAG: hypothetical protein Q8P13_03160 [bacterium]|nr:hypothetical protein [bacterium]